MTGVYKRTLQKNIFYRWLTDNKATAFTEAVILLPVMVSMLMGVYDLGRGITTNQRVIAASQIIGDLIARDRSVDMATLQDMIKAGELALDPYDTAPFGYDIVSLEFDDANNPVVLWRVTHNMQPNEEAVQSTAGLSTPGDGLIVVTTVYGYEPFFSNFVVDRIDMEEVAFLHGRRSSTVTCADCPT